MAPVQVQRSVRLLSATTSHSEGDGLASQRELISIANFFRITICS